MDYFSFYDLTTRHENEVLIITTINTFCYAELIFNNSTHSSAGKKNDNSTSLAYQNDLFKFSKNAFTVTDGNEQRRIN